MSLISEWVMQIIIFILIGTILELLIPNNTMKKYVNIVIGLLLLLILAKPILYLFQVDVTSELEKIEQTILKEQRILSDPINRIENQKNEIVAGQDAYIWNEVKLQMINEANPILMENYATQIVDVSLVFSNEFKQKENNLDKVVVSLAEKDHEIKQEWNVIKPIIIRPNEYSERQPQSIVSNDITSSLQQIWGLKKEHIQIIWEGGTS